ncbi:MAG: hypothetical protein ACI83I_002884 [Bacteroidia bacterium]|jgi:hypothetical protein
MVLLKIEVMDVVLQIIQFVIPSLVVFFVTYLSIQKYFDEDYKRRQLEYKSKTGEVLNPLRLQSYERLTIFLDRMKPDNLILRTADNRRSATEYKHELVSTVTEEFAHNVSQQLYVSDQAWLLIQTIKNDMLQLIETSYEQMPEQARATDLGKAIFQSLMNKNEDRVQVAINFLKKEINLVF